MRVLLITVGLALAGCTSDGSGFVWESLSTSANPAYLNGEQVVVIGCEAKMARCYDRAAQECPSGYEIIDESDVSSQELLGNRRQILQLKVSCR